MVGLLKGGQTGVSRDFEVSILETEIKCTEDDIGGLKTMKMVEEGCHGLFSENIAVDANDLLM